MLNLNTTKGTREWADKNINIFLGCSNNCRYCYAKKNALRFGRIQSEDQWKDMKPNEKSFNKKERLYTGRIMFPTSHDIIQENIDKCCTKIWDLISVGNKLLVTTKPNLECIKKICNLFDENPEFKKKIQFRFTITSYTDDQLEFWEPGAPTFNQRYDALRYAFNQGFQTSVSIEPLLTSAPMKLIILIYKLCTESIWIGTMNHFNLDNPDPQIKHETLYFEKIKTTKSKEFLKELYRTLTVYEEMQHENKIRWKDSIQKILNIDYLGKPVKIEESERIPTLEDYIK